MKRWIINYIEVYCSKWSKATVGMVILLALLVFAVIVRICYYEFMVHVLGAKAVFIPF